IEIPKIVGKPVALLRPLAASKATPVERHQGSLPLHRIHHELKRLAGIEPAVEQKYRRHRFRRLRPPTRQMHIESAYSQGLGPRLAQHPVRRHLVQSVVHPATEQSTYYTAHETADGGGRYGALRRLIAGQRGDAPARSCAYPR